eukprot:4464746-Alexandrium_andersonii.AAC.1
MRCVGSPIRTWPWWGSVNTAEPGPVHHASPAPVRSPFQWAMRRRSPHASPRACSMWSGAMARAPSWVLKSHGAFSVSCRFREVGPMYPV